MVCRNQPRCFGVNGSRKEISLPDMARARVVASPHLFGSFFVCLLVVNILFCVGLVFDYFVDPETKRFIPWEIPPYSLLPSSQEGTPAGPNKSLITVRSFLKFIL